MRLVIQRSKNSNVKVNEKIVGSIDKGLVILVSFTHSDNETDIDYMVNKVTNLRIFDDEFFGSSIPFRSESVQPLNLYVFLVSK